MHGEADLLATCYRNSLSLGASNDCKTIAFPAISCGIYKYPPELATKVALTQILTFLDSDAVFEKIYLACMPGEVLDAYLRSYETFNLDPDAGMSGD